MTERDIKLLWGRTGNRCTVCKSELSQDKKLSSEKFPLGEQAHIVGEKTTAPRGQSNLSPEEREGYHNRILVCPTHHVEIDRDEQFYSVERLHFIKQQHELWVQERLSEPVDNKKEAEQVIYSSLIDATVTSCRFQTWNQWVTMAGNSRPSWTEEILDSVHQFDDLIYRTPWPGSRPELENSLRTLAAALSRARSTFIRHSDCGHEQDGICNAVPFYKTIWRPQDEYDRLLAQYEEWEDECFFWLWISTKAANWVCEVVRRDINPMFYALEGRFVFEGGIRESGERIPEFDSTEKKYLPEGIVQMFTKYKSNQKNEGIDS